MFKITIKAESRSPLERKQIRKLVIAILKKHGLMDEVAVSITAVGDRKMAVLNKQYMEREGTTDVLAFPLLNSMEKGKSGFVFPPDNMLYLGDIVISFPQARRQAIEYQRTVDEEINTLVEHGLLHLLGIHHDD